jgi:hypothetical protein
LFKDEVEEIVDELVKKELWYLIKMLDKYYTSHIDGAGKHFGHRFGFIPNVSISKSVSDRVIRISVEVEIPNEVVEEIRKEVREAVLRSRGSSS